MTVVTLNQVAFLQRYPEFTATLTASPTAAQSCFNEAGAVYLDNRDCGRVPVPPRDTLLNMLTAHLLALYFGVNGQPPSRAVGRVSAASQGSVHATLEMGPANDQKAWYEQTMYGAAYWRASMGYRLGMIVPATDTPDTFFIREG